MKKAFIISIFVLLSTSLALSQSNSSEIYISPGMEFSVKDPFMGYTNQNSSSPSFAFQLAYQLIFKHAGFSASLEFMSRNIDLTRKISPEEFQTLKGQARADRIMLYFVGRAYKDGSSLSMDFRFGIGKLLTSDEFHFRHAPLSTIHDVIPGLCFATGIKSNYELTNTIGLFFDAKLSFLPYSYSTYNTMFWSQEWTDQSSYMADLGFYLGLKVNLNHH